MEKDQKKLREAKKQHRAWLLEQPGVQGADIGEDEDGHPCLRVFTDQATPETKKTIVNRLNDVSVRFAESGEIRPLGR